MFKKGQIALWGLLFLLASILISSIYLILKVVTETPVTGEDIKNAGVKVPTNSKDETWITYTSDLFNYKINYPSSLAVRQLGSGGGYIDFVRFEEGDGNLFKGFAVGVSEQSLANETERIKRLFESENAYLVQETSLNYNGTNAKRLYYKPQKIENSEERVVVIFSDGQYTYSISTVPGQINEMLSKFEFLN